MVCIISVNFLHNNSNLKVTDDQWKGRSFLGLAFMTKGISKNLLIWIIMIPQLNLFILFFNRARHFMLTTTPSFLKMTGRASEC